MISELELLLVGDAVAGDVRVVSELVCSALKVELAIVLVVEEVDDVEAVDELEVDEL